jgi:hypothetical protein
MTIVHVVPIPCIFESTIRQRADALGHECFGYHIHRSLLRNIADLWRLYRYCRRNPDNIFLFHRVPHLRLYVLSLLLRKFNYSLLYWGEEYYATFLEENAFEQHCIKKSALLRPEYYGQKQKPRCRSWVRMLRRRIGFQVVGNANAVLSLCPKQFRVLRHYYFRTMNVPLCTPHYRTRGYTPDVYARSQSLAVVRTGELRVLICHSATPSVAPHQTLQIIEQYKRRWGRKVHIRGFLSYSGGDETDRDDMEKHLTSAAVFAETVVFEREFLGPADMKARLDEIDVAVFSCLRDEGVGLLTQFVNNGGLVSFNRFSFNYDFFKHYSPGRLLTHEQFLAASPEEISRLRAAPREPTPRMVDYEQFEDLLR